MINLIKEGVFLANGRTPLKMAEGSDPAAVREGFAALGEKIDASDEQIKSARRGTIAASILASHDRGNEPGHMHLVFDALASHDITYVGVIQTARASGMEKFPVPYVLTNCHNSLCAVGGTINEDDHAFGLSAAKKYGGIFVPPHIAVIHSYMREMMSSCGSMILGSDSHTRYGALGTMGVGEGGPEIVKQLLGNTYDAQTPQVVAVYLKGAPHPGVGPQDVALALVGAVFSSGFVKNKVLEFIGPGVDSLSVDYRCGIDVMTTETTCLSSIWRTDAKVKEYYENHRRPSGYRRLDPAPLCYYDAMIEIDLSAVECMAALPFHPSNVYTIKELSANAGDILREVENRAREQYAGRSIDIKLTDKLRDGRIIVDQGVIAGCSGGTFENICEAAEILTGYSTGNGYFSLSVYPASAPINLALTKNGVMARLCEAGAIVRTAFCGPCFGAGDVPFNNGLSIRHTTRNFPNREGSKPADSQISYVALMDARSIAATAANGGVLTAASEVYVPERDHRYVFDGSIYEKRVYNGFGKADPSVGLKLGPNITDWPKQYPLREDILLRFACVINDPVTTTDELIPSGDTSSYRSNPVRLADFTLSRKAPEYVGRAKEIAAVEADRREGRVNTELDRVLGLLGKKGADVSVASVIFAVKPGDGSAREQAASCQRVLGGGANVACEYATKRYRSNLINWGMLPLTLPRGTKYPFSAGDYLYIEGIRQIIKNGREMLDAVWLRSDGTKENISLILSELGDNEKQILLDGCLMNYYANRRRS